MMRSLFSGVAGLKTHQTKMDVIGNNIANVNTTAYKSSSITFAAMMSQTTQRASGPNAKTGVGGTNARQIGLGVKSAAINTNISGQGASQSTGNPFDIMITGDNFFVVNNGNENFFTRDGSFYVDGAGNLAMTSTGYNVMGWVVDETTGQIKQDNVTALRIMSAANMTYPPEATSQAIVAGILDKNDKDVTSVNGKVVNLNFYDSLGYSYTARIVFKQSQNNNEYSIEVEKLLDSNGDEIPLTAEQKEALFGTPTTQLKQTNISFNSKAYEWSGKQLLMDGVVVADLDKIPVDAKGKFDTSKDDKIDLGTGTSANTATAQEQLDAIAKAYGYEGSTAEFLKYYKITKAADPVAGTPEEGLTVEDMLVAADFTNLPKGPDDPMTTDKDESTATFDGRKYTGSFITFDAKTGKFAGVDGSATNNTSVLHLSVIPALEGQEGSNFTDIVIDFSDMSMFDNKGTSTAAATSGDKDGLGSGRRLGDMIGVSIQKDGVIYASYDNGMTKILGQIATASFANASGLEKAGDNLYSATLNSGEFDGIGVDITANGGYMSTGQLEMSNVDLSSEFTEMITTQRGFQANSRIITVSDTLLEELTNLKR